MSASMSATLSTTLSTSMLATVSNSMSTNLFSFFVHRCSQLPQLPWQLSKQPSFNRENRSGAGICCFVEVHCIRCELSPKLWLWPPDNHWWRRFDSHGKKLRLKQFWDRCNWKPFYILLIASRCEKQEQCYQPWIQHKLCGCYDWVASHLESRKSIR